VRNRNRQSVNANLYFVFISIYPPRFVLVSSL
jgi:hypothetical protein